jgi:monoamine oxidase
MLIDRRSFLTGTAALAAAPALGQVPASGNVDVVIVGAGAAGIAAARRIASFGKRCVVVEAGNRIGGRCTTDTSIFGVPFDLGAHWIHMPDVNPVAKLAPRTGLEVYLAPPGQKVRIGRRNAREGEMEDFLATMVRSNHAIAEAARGKTDVSCAQALPRDLGEWRSTVEFVLGPYAFAKDLGDISAADFAKSLERDVGAYCRQGFGALLAKLAEGLPVQLSTPVKQINTWTRGRVEVQTEKGTLNGYYAIVTASTNALTTGKIKFGPELGKRQLEAAAKLELGSYDHIALEFPGNPYSLLRDELVFEKAERGRIATAALLANVSGTPLALVEVAGKFGRELSAKGEAEMVAFALDWLAGLYGADIRKAVKRTHATRWNEEPWVLGACSAAAPGGQPSRKILMEPHRDRIWLAGEAVHETLYGTVAGAWESGERAADAVLKRLGVAHTPAPARPEAERRKPRRERKVRRPRSRPQQEF